MESNEALHHLRTLIRTALETDDPPTLHKLLENMDVIVGKALAKKKR